jgi:hypothetical protein
MGNLDRRSRVVFLNVIIISIVMIGMFAPRILVMRVSVFMTTRMMRHRVMIRMSAQGFLRVMGHLMMFVRFFLGKRPLSVRILL